MRRVVICIDGFGPDYLAMSDTPNLDALARSGWAGVGQAVVPTVTNVNNASLLTGAFPDGHGITGNYYLEPETRRGIYMESDEFLLTPTVFERLAERGQVCALFTSKDKLRSLLGRGATLSASAESPPAWLIDLIGPPPTMYTAEVNLWLLDAATAVLAEHPEVEFLYLTTTDYVMHAYDPSHPTSQGHVRELDRRIGELLDCLHGDVGVVVTADHGMTAKRRALDPDKLLARHGLASTTTPIIKDRHVVHHQNLGGAAYVYLERPEEIEDARERLRCIGGVEEVMFRGQAAERFRLHAGRIGDLMVLADRETVFGFLPQAEESVDIRSHGSLHEADVPVIVYGVDLGERRPEYGKDAVTALLK